MRRLWDRARVDGPASVVVFLVAVPLCLGIALGSGAPLLSGIVAGVVGGLVVGALSRSPLSVSGPAAGLTVIVAAAITATGSFQAFLVAVVIAGLLQIGAGVLKLGSLGDFVPNSVIKGMLAAIGLLLILKQAPHLVGYDRDFTGDDAFFQRDGETTFSALAVAARAVAPAAAAVGLAALLVLWLWERPALKKRAAFKAVPGPMVAVLVAVGLHELLALRWPELRLSAEHLVQLPAPAGPGDLVGQLAFPDLRQLGNLEVWKAGATLAVVASLETLLSIAAVDKLDPLNRVTPPNRELVAQGVGNTLSGLLGGLPVTSVIVRSSANVNAGARTRLSTMMHGALLLLSALFFARFLNLVPLAALAAILVFTGYKLARVELFREHFAQGWDQFVPFLATIAAILLTDLLVGVVLGIAVGAVFVLRTNFQRSLLLVSDGDRYLLRLRKDVSFFSKPVLRRTLEEVPAGSYLLVDLSRADFIDHDVVDVLNEFAHHAQLKDIRVEVRRNAASPAHRRLKLDAPTVAEPTLEQGALTP